jgi:hypothetical protein
MATKKPAITSLECLKCSKVPKMPKVNEIFVRFKIELARGEHLNFRSLETRSVGKGKAKNF